MEPTMIVSPVSPVAEKYEKTVKNFIGTIGRCLKTITWIRGTKELRLGNTILNKIANATLDILSALLPALFYSLPILYRYIQYRKVQPIVPGELAINALNIRVVPPQHPNHEANLADWAQIFENPNNVDQCNRQLALVDIIAKRLSRYDTTKAAKLNQYIIYARTWLNGNWQEHADARQLTMSQQGRISFADFNNLSELEKIADLANIQMTFQAFQDLNDIQKEAVVAQINHTYWVPLVLNALNPEEQQEQIASMRRFAYEMMHLHNVIVGFYEATELMQGNLDPTADVVVQNDMQTRIARECGRFFSELTVGCGGAVGLLEGFHLGLANINIPPVQLSVVDQIKENIGLKFKALATIVFPNFNDDHSQAYWEKLYPNTTPPDNVLSNQHPNRFERIPLRPIYAWVFNRCFKDLTWAFCEFHRQLRKTEEEARAVENVNVRRSRIGDIQLLINKYFCFVAGVNELPEENVDQHGFRISFDDDLAVSVIDQMNQQGTINLLTRAGVIVQPLGVATRFMNFIKSRMNIVAIGR